MKEYTFIINAQLTSIIESKDDANPLPIEQIRENLKEILDDTGMFDDVVISSVQMFELDKED